jgi:plasmid rolling circle replication initiator protein Rep
VEKIHKETKTVESVSTSTLSLVGKTQQSANEAILRIRKEKQIDQNFLANLLPMQGRMKMQIITKNHQNNSYNHYHYINVPSLNVSISIDSG